MRWTLLMTIIFTSCAYQFSNLHARPPEGVRTIAIEAIYDTSQRAIPHEILWESLQRAFNEKGRLRVTSVAGADAYLQTQIIEATSGQNTPIPGAARSKDPEINRDTPDLPGAFQKLTQATTLADREFQRLKVEVKVWQLSSRKLLFSKTYSLSTRSYKILDNTATKDSQFLRSDEAFRNNFRKIAADFGTQVERDFVLTQ